MTQYVTPFGENKGIMFQYHCQDFDVFDGYESGDKDLKPICGVHCFALLQFD